MNAEQKYQMGLFIEQFLEKISLPRGKYEWLTERYEEVGEYLRSSDGILEDAAVFPQGSVALQTLIRPIGQDEFDLDVVCYLPDQYSQGAMAVYEAVKEHLASHPSFERLIDDDPKRCVRLQYADTYRFHIDITPAVRDPRDPKVVERPRIYVTDTSIEDWSPSHPKGFRQWFEQIASERPTYTYVLDSLRKRHLTVAAKGEQEPLPDQDARQFDVLRRTVQLLKRHRDAFFLDRPDAKFRPISAVITTLAAHAYAAAVRSCG